MSIIDDHSRSLNDFKPMGIPILAQYLGDSCKSMNMGEFTVKPFDLTTIDGNWTHTNANGEPCPIYGFLITHKEMGRMLYITDTNLISFSILKTDIHLLSLKPIPCCTLQHLHSPRKQPFSSSR